MGNAAKCWDNIKLCRQKRQVFKNKFCFIMDRHFESVFHLSLFASVETRAVFSKNMSSDSIQPASGCKALKIYVSRKMSVQMFFSSYDAASKCFSTAFTPSHQNAWLDSLFNTAALRFTLNKSVSKIPTSFLAWKTLFIVKNVHLIHTNCNLALTQKNN